MSSVGPVQPLGHAPVIPPQVAQQPAPADNRWAITRWVSNAATATKAKVSATYKKVVTKSQGGAAKPKVVVPTDEALKGRFTTLINKIEDLSAALPPSSQEIIARFIGLPNTDLPSTLDEALVRKEEKILKKIEEHIFHLSGITVFNQFILRNTPPSTLSFYTNYAQYTDPTKAYYTHLYMRSKVAYVLAKVCIPIIKWFVGLILKPKGNEGGLPALLNKVKVFFSNKANVQMFLINEMSNATKYFDLLHTIHHNYCTLIHPPYGSSTPVTTQSLEDYVKETLNETLYEERICKGVNNRLIKELTIKTGGLGIVDAIANRIFKSVISKMNPTQMVINSMMSSAGNIDTTFSHNIFLIIKEMLDNATKQIEDNSQKETTLPAGTRISSPRLADDLFTENDKRCLKEFVAVFFKYLPLEGTTRYSLHENMLTGGLLTPALVTTAGEALIDVTAKIVHQFSKPADNLNLRLKVLRPLKNLFIIRPPLNLDTYARTRKDTFDSLKKLVTTALEDTFKTEYFARTNEETHEKINFSIRNLKDNIQSQADKIAEINTTLSAEITRCSLEDTERNNIIYLAQLRKTANILQDDVIDLLDYKKLDSKAKNIIKIQMEQVIISLENLIQLQEDIQKKINLLNTTHSPLYKEISSLLPQDPVDDGRADFPERVVRSKMHPNNILLGKTKDAMVEIFSSIEQKIQALPPEQQFLLTNLSESKEKATEINSLNKDFFTRLEIKVSLSSLISNLKNANALNQAILSRPETADLEAIYTKIYAIKNGFHDVERNRDINQITPLLSQIKADCQDLSDLFGKTNQEDLLAIKVIFDNLQLRVGDLETIHKIASENPIRAIKEYFARNRNLNTIDQQITSSHQLLRALPAHNTADQRAFTETITRTHSEAIQKLNIEDLKRLLGEAEVTVLLAQINKIVTENAQDNLNHQELSSLINQTLELFQASFVANEVAGKTILQAKRVKQEELLVILETFISKMNEVITSDWSEISEASSQISDKNVEFKTTNEKFTDIKPTDLLKYARPILAWGEKKLISREIASYQEPLFNFLENANHIKQLAFRGPIDSLIQTNRI